MDYDFSAICEEQLVKIEKRFKSLHKSFIKEYSMALNVINHDVTLENKPELLISAETMLDTVKAKCQIIYRDYMVAVQRELSKYL